MKPVRAVGVVTLPLIGVLALLESGAPPVAITSAATERRECPHNWLEDTARTFPKVSERSTIAEMSQDVPEFNDCQRFILDDGSGRLEYGELFAIFAAQDLAAFPERLDALRGDTRSDPLALAAAEIIGDASYRPLNIAQGRNCLYVWRTRSVTRTRTEQWTWHAAMLNPQSSPVKVEQCYRTVAVNDLAGITELQVRRSPQATRASDVPAVARWDFDETHKIQYLGIRCGDAWCEIGRPGFTPASASATQWGGTVVDRHKGWHDRQRLAANLDSDDGLEVTDILGTITPSPALEHLTTLAPYQSRWFESARMRFESLGMTRTPPGWAKYRDHLGLRDDTVLPVTLNIWQCFGTAVECMVDVGATECVEHDLPVPVGTGKRWFTRVEHNGVRVKSFCAARFPNVPVDYDNPGAARWRWKAADEGAWISCIYGCCEQF